MPDFLLELLSEEIPARMQAKASSDLARLFAEELAKSGLQAERIEHYATPRRLALIARNLPAETEAVSEELKGPRASAPPQALEGFLRKTGLTADQLVERDGILFAVVEKPGRATAHVIAEAVPAIVRTFPWPKSMRWGAASATTESLRWVRPLHAIVALLDGEIVPFEIDGIASGAETVGHRFHHPGCITIGSADDYAAKLRACHVILDAQERRAIIADGARKAASDAGLTLVEDEGLLAENAGLTEWPVPLLGSFDPSFLEVPREVIQLTMRTNQKYFALNPPPPGEVAARSADGGGALAPNFICTANIDAHDGGRAIVAGNEKVLAARLSDAKFFWEQDLKIPLEEPAKKLDQIVFHEKLGTVADKVDRVAKLARWLIQTGVIPANAGTQDHRDQSPAAAPSTPATLGPGVRRDDSEALAQMAETAARLCKADLVTGMVGEFPELQGVMGGYYARAQGLPQEVADAIRDHYKPVGQGDEVPTAPVTVAVSLADKLDIVLGFFAWDLTPTGSKDPFALRRTANAINALCATHNLRLPLRAVAEFAAWSFIYNRVFSDHEFQQVFLKRYFSQEQLEDENFGTWFEKSEDGLWSYARTDTAVLAGQVFAFLTDRLKVQQREAGVRHDLIDAVFALGGEDDLVRLLARVKALQAFVATDDGANLLAGYKRAANILKKEGWPPSTPANAGAQGHDGGNVGSGSSTAEPLGPGVRRDDSGKTLSYTPESEEAALIAALDSAEPRAAKAIEAEDFEGAMTALASLRAPIDAFFDKVMVNDPDEDKRTARLDMLARLRDAVHRVADFSRIEG